MQKRLTRYVEALTAVCLLAVIVAPVAFADASEAEAKTSAKANVGKTLVKLRKQVGALQRQVAALQAQSGAPATPTGLAGGDLTGVFPNPSIGPDAVGAAEIQANAVGSGEIAEGAVNGPKIANESVTGAKIADRGVLGADLAENSVTGSTIAEDAVGASDILFDSVGASELKGVTPVASAGTTISAAGGPGNADVTCPPGQMVIGGGYAWQDDEPNSIVYSAPSEANPNQTWTVRGIVAAGSNRLFAWANCLTP